MEENGKLNEINLSMIKKFICKATLLCTSMFMMYSCQKDELTTASASPETNESISFEASAENEEEIVDETSLRALNYGYEDNLGKDYPKAVLKFRDGDKVPVVLVLQRANKPASRVLAETTFTFRVKGKSLKDPISSSRELVSASQGKLYTSGDIAIPNKIGLSTNQTDWKVLSILGGELKTASDGKKVLVFKTSTPEIVNTKDSQKPDIRSLESVYMNEEWNDVVVTSDKHNALSMYVKSTIKLRNQGVMLMCRAKNAYPKALPLRGFRIAASNLAFRGFYNLTDLTFGQKPDFTPIQDGHRLHLRPSNAQGKKERQTLAPQELSNFFLCVGIPTVKTTMKNDPQDATKKLPQEFETSLHVSSLLGDAYEVEGKVHEYLKKSVTHSSFISIKTVELAQRTLLHPIESFMADEETGIIFRKEDPNYFEAVLDADNAARQELGEAGRYFKLPSENHLRILFPNMRQGEANTDMGAGSVPILNMGQNGVGQNNVPTWDTANNNAYVLPMNKRLPEKITAWGETNDYHAEYKMTINRPDLPAYGRRFKGSPKYQSAYRYQAVMKDGKPMMEIRVRFLTSQKYKNYPIDWIAREKFWNTPTAWNEREIVRYVAQGRYWSNTKYNRVSAPKGAVSVAKVLLDKKMDAQTTYRYGAFVTDSKRRAWMEDPRVKSNWVNSGFTLVTDQPSAVR